MVPGYSCVAACRHSPTIIYQIQLPVLLVLLIVKRVNLNWNGLNSVIGYIQLRAYSQPGTYVATNIQTECNLGNNNVLSHVLYS